MFKSRIEEMSEGKGKELLKILSEKAQPFIRKCDGYATKIEEDKEITYKDNGDQELTLKVPAGSYLVVGEDGCYPEIVTSESFEAKNKIVGEKKEIKTDVKAEKGPKIGMAIMADDSEY